MTSQGVVYVDGTPDEYRDLRLPKNWTAHYARQWGGLQASMQWAFREFPDATQYGWLADDTLPRTDNWDTRLEAAAGDWCLSCARDLWLSETEHMRVSLEEGDDLSSGLCWGGELVREVGWWALPGAFQAGIDTSWCQIVGPLGLARYTPAVTVEHLNYKTGKRPADAVDHNELLDHDLTVQRTWAASAEYEQILGRVRVAANVELDPVARRRFKARLRDSLANRDWTPTAPAARLANALERIDEHLDQTVTDLLGPDTNVEPA